MTNFFEFSKSFWRLSKKREGKFFVIYGRLRSISNIAAPMAAMNTNNPAIAGMKYCSDMDGGGSVVGSGVAMGSMTVKAVVAVDGQYPLVPVKVAMT